MWKACLAATAASRSSITASTARGFRPRGLRSIWMRRPDLPLLHQVRFALAWWRLTPGGRAMRPFSRPSSRLPPGLPVRAYVIGGPAYQVSASQWTRADLVRRASDLGLDGRIGFLDFQVDTSPVYRALDVVVHASTAPEPFGLVIAEAMSCGRPVVISDAGGAREIGDPEQTCVAHPPGDVEALARQMERLVNDAALRARLGAAAACRRPESFLASADGRRLARDVPGNERWPRRLSPSSPTRPHAMAAEPLSATGRAVKIAVVSYGLPRPGFKRGGIERVAHDLSDGLARRGHDVTVFSHDPLPPHAAYKVLPLPWRRFVEYLGRTTTDHGISRARPVGAAAFWRRRSRHRSWRQPVASPSPAARHSGDAWLRARRGAHRDVDGQAHTAVRRLRARVADSVDTAAVCGSQSEHHCVEPSCKACHPQRSRSHGVPSRRSRAQRPADNCVCRRTHRPKARRMARA